MRLLIYNIAYGTGAPDFLPGQIFTMHRYIRTPRKHLDKIASFIDEYDPDIAGIVEVDTGSYRTNYLNQLEALTGRSGHYYTASVKYGRHSLGRAMPFFRNQANAILTKEKIPAKNFHYFPVGFKRLIIELEYHGIHFFLVHLALQQATRKAQLEYLAALAADKGPVIIAGDFNTFSGEDELLPLQKKLKLCNPNAFDLPTYPSWAPSKQLDFVLCSESLNLINFEIPMVTYSDHLPIILDFTV